MKSNNVVRGYWGSRHGHRFLRACWRTAFCDPYRLNRGLYQYGFCPPTHSASPENETWPEVGICTHSGLRRDVWNTLYLRHPVVAGACGPHKIRDVDCLECERELLQFLGVRRTPGPVLWWNICGYTPGIFHNAGVGQGD